MMDHRNAMLTETTNRQRAMLDRLMRRQGLDRYAFFLVTGEGRFFPNGLEDASGRIIDDHGRVFSFWTGWDDDLGEETLIRWRQIEPQPRWERSREYRAAREAVGLT